MTQIQPTHDQHPGTPGAPTAPSPSLLAAPPTAPRTASDSAPAGGPLTGYRRAFDVAYAWLSMLFLAGVLAQFFLAGVGAFHRHGTPGVGFGPHEVLGNALGITACVLLVLSLVARSSWRTVICALVLSVLTEVAQHGLAQFGKDNQWIGAAHALDGTIILLLAAGLALTSIRRTRASRATG